MTYSTQPIQPAQNPPPPPPSAAEPTRSSPNGTRTARTWAALVLGGIVLLVLLVFILENGQSADFAFLGAHVHLPLGVAMLFSALAGALIMGLAGGARIVQLRHQNRKNSRLAS